MLFPYKYVPHQMEKMQKFIDFIFHEVWCKAPIGLVFHPDLFDGNPELKSVMSEFGFTLTAAKRGKTFYKEVKIIYEIFASLSSSQIDQLKKWYQGNNDLEKVCTNDPTSQIAHYPDIAAIHNDLAIQLKVFFKDLYSKDLLSLNALRAKIGEIDDHYRTFITKNKNGKCPFCGINDLLGEYHSRREAYDHYLPKAHYPFNSINFKNLVPACHHCNSSYKTSKDPAFIPKDPALTTKRRAVFYPYTETPYAIELEVAIQKSNTNHLTPSDIDLQFGPIALNEQIETWKDVYGIEERYKAKLCEGDDCRYWLGQVLDEWKENGRCPADYLKTVERQAKIFPHADCNFLKKPFLDACQKNGIFQKPNGERCEQ